MLEIAAITGALGGLKTATDLLKGIRDGIKSKRMKLDEVDSRISEAYDHVVEAKAALIEAKDEISRMQGELAKLRDIRDGFDLRDNVFWRKGTKDAYCPFCLGANETAVPLLDQGGTWYCGIHDRVFAPRSAPEPGIQVWH